MRENPLGRRRGSVAVVLVPQDQFVRRRVVAARRRPRRLVLLALLAVVVPGLGLGLGESRVRAGPKRS